MCLKASCFSSHRCLWRRVIRLPRRRYFYAECDTRRGGSQVRDSKLRIRSPASLLNARSVATLLLSRLPSSFFIYFIDTRHFCVAKYYSLLFCIMLLGSLLSFLVFLCQTYKTEQENSPKNRLKCETSGECRWAELKSLENWKILRSKDARSLGWHRFLALQLLSERINLR